MTKEEYLQKVDELKVRYNDFVQSENIKVLNLIMKKNYALDIINGKKTVEFRSYSQHYISRLYDKKVLAFLNKHEKAKDAEDLNLVCDPMRVVEKIHFHDYNNTWYLDIECIGNGVVTTIAEDADFLAQRFGSTELQEEARYLDSIGEDKRPLYFYFALGKVLETNLK